MATTNLELPTCKASPHALALRGIGERSADAPIAAFPLGELDVEIRSATDSLWLLIRRQGRGGVALRAAYLVGAFTCKAVKAEPGEIARLEVTSSLGLHVIAVRAGLHALENVRVTVRLTPEVSTSIPFMPRDLYPLDANDDPWVRAAASK